MKTLALSVVIPCFDEMANLQKGTLEKVHAYLTRHKYSFELIVVDDGSSDGSREFVRKFAKEHESVHLVENSHSGKAAAVTAGVLFAKGELILFTDMDQATPIEELTNLLPYFDKGYDIVIGSRTGRRRGSPLSRRIMSKSAIILRSLIVGLPLIRDTQCGFKMFTKKAATDIFSQLKSIHQGYSPIKGSSVTSGFDVELLYLGILHGYKIKEVPVEWLYVETRRVSPIKDSVDGVLDLLKIRLNILKGIYK